MPVKFLANHNCIVAGPTGAGKTHFLLNVIDKKLIHPFPKNIFWMYSCEQEFMSRYPNITFIKGLDFSKVDTSEPSAVIFDDLMLNINKEVASSFIMSSHHKKISIFLVVQTLFINCDVYRLMSINCHYMVIFKNPRNFRQLHTLARQIYVGRDVFRVLECYKRACNSTRGFIVLSFSPLLPPELTVLTDFFKPWPSIYL